ncbi:MAG: winged helix-turn-helix domain-containing protein [Bryobacterales bacterium]|nr:winged helix-turn-helix domain-containing protein [Bryobacterales bacterium]
MESPRKLQFDTVTMDFEKLEIRKDGEALEIEPRSFRVLAYLARNANRVVTKEELLQEVWSGAFVTDNALTRVVAQLRKALGDDARQARYIETVPAVGYRFVAEVRPVEQAQAPATPAAAAETQTPRKINWFIPIAALGAIAFSYFYPMIREWTGSAPPALNPVQFTTSTGLDSGSSFSPDGSSIAYSSDKSGHFEIYVKQVASGGRELAITSDGKENLQPSWSPDGSRIAYCSRAGQGIYVVSALGGAPRRITDFGAQPSWSADSKSIVFRSQGVLGMAWPEIVPSVTSNLWTVPAGGGKAESLTQAQNPPGRHTEPHYGPDGKYMSFLSNQPGRNNIMWELNLQTRQMVKLLDGGPNPVSFVYAPDGLTMLFVGVSRVDTLGLYQLPRNSDSRKPLTAPQLITRVDFVYPRDLAISAKGDRIAYTATNMISNLWRVTQDGETRQVTNESSYRVTQPQFSPDGEKLAYLLRKRGLLSDVWMSNADGSNASQITRNPGWDYMMSWTPDGKGLIYGALRDGRPGVWQYSLTDGSERQLTDLNELYWMARISPDGKEILYHKEDGGVLNVWKMDTASKRRTQLTFGKEAIGFACWSPDGKQIALELRQGDDDQVGILSSEGGPIRQLTHHPGNAWTYGWSPDGKHLPVAALWDGVWNVYSLDVATGRSVKMTDNKLFRTFVRYPVWSPKGGQVVFEQNETKGNIFLAGIPR